MKNDSKEIFFPQRFGRYTVLRYYDRKKNVIAPPDSLFQMGKRKKRREGNFTV